MDGDYQKVKDELRHFVKWKKLGEGLEFHPEILERIKADFERSGVEECVVLPVVVTGVVAKKPLSLGACGYV